MNLQKNLQISIYMVHLLPFYQHKHVQEWIHLFYSDKWMRLWFSLLLLLCSADLKQTVVGP